MVNGCHFRHLIQQPTSAVRPAMDPPQASNAKMPGRFMAGWLLSLRIGDGVYSADNFLGC